MPVSLKVFLTALAILDDLGAVVIIAVFYTADLSAPMLAARPSSLAVLVGLNRSGVDAAVALSPARRGALVLRAAVRRPRDPRRRRAGAHDPAAAHPGPPGGGDSPLHRLEHALQPWVAFLIVPIFGFANAGVSFAGMALRALLEPVPLGIALGLFVGKQIGVFAFAWRSIRAGLADLPADATWAQLYGVALLCGIGFTMSLFIGVLAFPDLPDLRTPPRSACSCGSVLSALAGCLVLRLAPPERLSPARPRPCS